MPLAAPIPENEEQRLAALRRYNVLDTPPEPEFDRITALAAELFGAQISLVSLVDTHRQWFKSACGLDASETPRELAFCAYAILEDDVFEVPDATKDPRFADSPLVVGPPHIKTYAGAPLIDRQGFRLGTLCVIFTERVSEVTEAMRRQLRTLAAVVVDELELRLALVAATEARAQAEAAHRVKAQFLANMSHEIRTPMTGVLGMLDLIGREKSAEARARHAERARLAARNLLAILDDILDFSKLESGRVEIEYAPVNVRTLCDVVVALFQAAADDKGIDLSATVDPAVPQWLTGDAARIQQVLANLVGNAVKFTFGGRVEIAVGFGAEGAEGKLVCTVADTGIGIPQDAVAHVFDRFAQADSTTTRRFGGTGLGLAICRELLDLMDGEIGVESVAGEGSIFRFALPMSPCDVPCPEDGTERSARTESVKGRGLRVLVAEDNDLNQLLIRRFLEAEGCEITMVSDGAAAIDAVRSGNHDVVLMDHHMPVMDGMEATRRIRALDAPTCEIPIVALTANDFAGDRERYLACGMNGYLTKPIDAGRLYDELERVARGISADS